MGLFIRLLTQLGRQLAAPLVPQPAGNRPRTPASGLPPRPARGRGTGARKAPQSRPFRAQPGRTPPRQKPTRPHADSRWSGIAYHGTPHRTNAKAIFQNGFLVGNGNASGDGVYFATEPAIAKSYAGSQGVILKCQLRGRCCQWTDQLQAQYAQWCSTNGVRQDNSARTAFLIQRGYDLLRTGSVVVVLSPQMTNPSAWQMKDRRIRVLGAYDSATDQRIRV